MTASVSLSVAYVALSARPAQGASSFHEATAVVNCPKCEGHLMTLPRPVPVIVLDARGYNDGSGRGRVTRCRNRQCKRWFEVIENG